MFMSKVIKNSLGYDSNLYVYQDKEMFNYSVDTILLGNFATVNKKTLRVLDLGTNNGALSIFFSERYSKMKIDAIDIQDKAIELAKKNIKLNKKEEMIFPQLWDFNDFYKHHNKNQMPKYDSVICNPPYYKMDSHLIKQKGQNESILTAMFEYKITLEDIVKGSSKILNQKGFLALVVPIERYVDLCVLMRKYSFEVKRVQIVSPRVGQKPTFSLVEGRYQSGWGTHFLPSLYLHPKDKNKHVYTDEVKELYKPLLFNK